jgi:hypothetical protein
MTKLVFMGTCSHSKPTYTMMIAAYRCQLCTQQEVLVAVEAFFRTNNLEHSHMTERLPRSENGEQVEEQLLKD